MGPFVGSAWGRVRAKKGHSASPNQRPLLAEQRTVASNGNQSPLPFTEPWRVVSAAKIRN